MMVKSSKTLYEEVLCVDFIKTEAAKWDTKAKGAIREDMKGVFLQNAIIPKARQHRKNKDRKMEVRGGAIKRERRGRQSGSHIDRLSPPTPTLTQCLEALKHKSLWGSWKAVFLNQIFIQCKASVAPLPTFNHWPLFTTRIQNQKDKATCTHSTHNIHSVTPFRLLTLLVLILRW